MPALRGSIPRENIANQLLLLKNELKEELDKVQREDLLDFSMFTPEKFDSATYRLTYNTISTLRKRYLIRYDKFSKKKETIFRKATSSQKHPDKYFLRLKTNYSNQQLSNIVKNNTSTVRILEFRNKLIRKIDPIYSDPEMPSNPFNFRTHYYAPRKVFMGSYFDTYGFNLIIIWIMTILSLIALYLNVLKSIVKLFETISEINIYKYVAANQYIIRKRLGR